MPDVEKVVEGLEGQESQTVEIPEHASGKTQTRQELIDQTLSEAGEVAGEESVIDTLASKEGQLTVEDLRKLPGAEGLSDDQLKMEWARAVKAQRGTEGTEEVEGTEGQQGQETFKLPFPVYGPNGEKIEALEQINIRDFFEGKIKLGYNALGKEQQKTLAEALRNASMGHWNEQKYTTTLAERDRVASELAAAQEQVKTFNSERAIWQSALSALAMGNIAPMKALAQAYQQELTKGPADVPGMVPVDQARAEQEEVARGNEFIRQTIIPAGMEIAQRYEANVKEVMDAIEFYVRREGRFLTQEKIDSILKYEVPQLFESNGYVAKDTKTGPAITSKAGDVEELRKTVEALQSRIAETKNKSVETLRSKQKKAPPAGGGSTPGAGDSMPSFKNRAQMKAWMQGDENWAKA